MNDVCGLGMRLQGLWSNRPENIVKTIVLIAVQ